MQKGALCEAAGAPAMLPRISDWVPPRSACCLVAAWLSVGTAGAAEAEERSLRQVTYDYAVTSYCGTLTPEVEAGFRRELAEVTARDGLSEADAKAQRIAGWVNADEEWGNRGLGGFRAWCQSEGAEAAAHFTSFATGVD